MPSALKPWHAVAIPHDDIQKGRLSEAVFAANLWAVLSSQRGPTIFTIGRVMSDPRVTRRRISSAMRWRARVADAHVSPPVAVTPFAGWTPSSSKTVKCLSHDCARR